MHRFANPSRFVRLTRPIVPWTGALTAILFLVGLYLALVVSPPDYQQKDTVRIMYVHVPAAWMAMMAFGVVAVASAVALIWKHPLADLAAKAASPIGAGFTFICLVTGSLWGEPTWGTWWVWDARLTSMLILLFIYLGHMAIMNAFDDPARGAKAAAIVALVGAVDLPIIKFSVDWWNTLHQPASVSDLGTPALHDSMLAPLLVMYGAYLAFFITVVLLRIRSEILARKIQSVRQMQVNGPVAAE